MDREHYELVRRMLDEVIDLEPEERALRMDAANLDPDTRALLEELIAAEDADSTLFAEENMGAVRQDLLEAAPGSGGGEAPQHPQTIGAYRILEPIGEGGMGVVYSARGEGSTTPVALKVLRPGLDSGEVLKRFAREAELLEQLRHPGIAAFYDTGEARIETRHGQTTLGYLAMELVEGPPLGRYADEHELDDRQRIELLARVCDAVHHAHGIGAVHRDLKPSNILVEAVEGDPVGRPKVLDFGIARAEDADVRTMTATRTGAVIGTLAYMSPEQAVADRAIDARSDVYSLGVLLYELLARELPVDIYGESLPRAIELIQYKEPNRLGRYSSSYSGDLEWVCMRALEKEPHRRYATAAQLADDLRAYLAGRPVTARSPGLARRLRYFAARQPAAASAIGLGALVLIASSVFFVEALHAGGEARASEREALESESLALERTRETERQRAAILRLADLRRVRELRDVSHELWPAVPMMVPELEAWLDEARELATRLEQHRTFQQELAAWGTDEISQRRLEWWRQKQAELVEELSTFCDPETGLLGGVARRAEAAATLWERSIEAYTSEWNETIEQVSAHPSYAGMELVPQLGLVPIGPDPASGLWEFWHVASGARPVRDAATGRLVVSEDMGIVFVLVPGGRAFTGSQNVRPEQPNYDPNARADEPYREYTFPPQFVAKYELTQGQWRIFAGGNPSLSSEERPYGRATFDRTHPVESVTWYEGRTFLGRLDLRMPTEEEWERAARAGSSTPWWCGARPESLASSANLADQSARELEELAGWTYESWYDGFGRHAPVGSLEPNAFGLHDVLGNVAEWCWEHFDQLGPDRLLRGGSYSSMAIEARVAARGMARGDTRRGSLGLRAVRDVDAEERGRPRTGDDP